MWEILQTTLIEFITHSLLVHPHPSWMGEGKIECAFYVLSGRICGDSQKMASCKCELSCAASLLHVVCETWASFILCIHTYTWRKQKGQYSWCSTDFVCTATNLASMWNMHMCMLQVHGIDGAALQTNGPVWNRPRPQLFEVHLSCFYTVYTVYENRWGAVEKAVTYIATSNPLTPL